jgi:phosphoglycerate dehydrogenase-like enzyme
MHVVVIPSPLNLPVVTDSNRERIVVAAGPGTRVSVVDSPADAVPVAADMEVLLGLITPPLLEAAPKLRWVHAIASGVDQYLFPAFKQGEVILTGEKGNVGSHLADHAFGLLLSLTRGLAKSTRLHSAAWDHRMEFRRDNFELEGLTMGIVGLGGTGRAIARRAAAFGMLCQAVDRDEVTTTPEVAEVRPMSAFADLLESSDVVAVCCPLTDETRDLFDDAAFERMKPEAIIVNVTRGGIIDGDALVRALESGQIAAAGLDVAPQEPLPPDHALWGLDNVVMTPHTAGASQLRPARNFDRFCRNLEHLRRGEPLEGVVDKQLGF